MISEFICIEHPPGFAKNKAQAWWKKRTGLPMPETAEEAAHLGNAGCLAEPLEILIQDIKGAKWPELKGVKLGEIPIAAAPLEEVALGEDLPF